MDKLLDLTRDFDVAKAAFEAYLDEYLGKHFKSLEILETIVR